MTERLVADAVCPRDEGTSILLSNPCTKGANEHPRKQTRREQVSVLVRSHCIFPVVTFFPCVTIWIDEMRCLWQCLRHHTHHWPEDAPVQPFSILQPKQRKQSSTIKYFCQCPPGFPGAVRGVIYPVARYWQILAECVCTDAESTHLQKSYPMGVFQILYEACPLLVGCSLEFNWASLYFDPVVHGGSLFFEYTRVTNRYRNKHQPSNFDTAFN